METLKDLNAEQMQAVESNHDRILCLAGAGTGKTKTLTSRIARLYYDGVKPAEMLALTFTRAAGQEMKERVVEMIGEDGKALFCNTFHAWAVKVIRQYAFQIGYTPTFTIYDEEDREDIVKQIIDELQYRVNSKDVIEAMRKKFVYGSSITDADIQSIVSEYNFRIRKNNAIDLDGLLMGLQRLLANSQIRDILRRQWEYVFVDEFQDTDRRQMEILHVLNPKNLFVVGDDFQSIYKFRGADVTIIMDLAENPDYEVIKLEENYRSTDTIVSAANALIKYNNQTEKILKSHRKGAEIKLLEAGTEEEEALRIIDRIELHINRDEMRYSDFAILGRTNKQIERIAEALKNAHIPCTVKTAAADVLMSADAKKLFTFMKVMLNPCDDVSITSVLNWPTMYLTHKQKLDVEMFQLENECSLYTALAATGKAERFFEIYHGIEEQIVEDYDLGEEQSAIDLLKYVINASGIMRKYEADGLLSRNRDIESIVQHVARWQEARIATGETFTAEDWLDYYVQRNVEGERVEEHLEDAVQIMTAHGSKGLEFNVVFIAGCNQKTFPMLRGDLEEERRLFYVAITRAKNQLYLTRAAMKAVWGSHEEETEKSMFIEELSGV